MRLEKIELFNIGAYHGENIFDLSLPSPDKKIILIGGENGAGKTTFLNAIKLGLFGCFAYGFKNESKGYLDQVYRYLNATERLKTNASFSIRIDFTEVENYKATTYGIKRTWHKDSQRIKETYFAYRDGSMLSDADMDILFEKLRENFPPKLFDLCLFDGEEISRIIIENRLPEYLKDLSDVIFNLDLFKSLEDDLYGYIENELDQNQLSDLEKEVFDLQEEKGVNQQQISELKLVISKLKEERAATEDRISVLKKDFDTHGGLVKQERDALNAQVTEIETVRRMNAEKVKEFISTLLPFYLNRELVSKTMKQLQAEENTFISNKVLAKMNEKDFSNLVGSEAILESIKNYMRPEGGDVEMLHSASLTQKIQFSVVASHIGASNHQNYLALIDENQKLLEETSKMRKQIADNDATHEFKKILEELEKLTPQLTTFDGTIQKAQEDVETLEQKNEQLKTSIEAKEALLYQGSKKQGSFAIAQSVMKLSQEFQALQQQKKLQQVQIEATRMINKIMRKNKYITAIRISPETFKVTLHDINRNVIEKETLSAGEKEILLLALIYAMFKCSGRRVPFIFDTLLGRLDQAHKRNILVDFIPKCGEQVLILSTNSEIDDKYYGLLEKHVSHRYLLEFDTDKRKINVKNEYFSFQEVVQ